MSLILKENPRGIDFWIDLVQSKVYADLTKNCGWASWESCHRAYKNPKSGTVIPEKYVGDGEYVEVLYNDAFNINSFFLGDDNRAKESEIFTQDVSWIFQANISDLYEKITHRADEEFNTDLLNALEKIPFVRNVRMVTGVNNVYSDLNLNAMVEFDDMSELHVVKVDMEAKYTICQNNTSNTEIH